MLLHPNNKVDIYIYIYIYIIYESISYRKIIDQKIPSEMEVVPQHKLFTLCSIFTNHTAYIAYTAYTVYTV